MLSVAAVVGSLLAVAVARDWIRPGRVGLVLLSAVPLLVVIVCFAVFVAWVARGPG